MSSVVPSVLQCLGGWLYSSTESYFQGVFFTLFFMRLFPNPRLRSLCFTAQGFSVLLYGALRWYFWFPSKYTFYFSLWASSFNMHLSIPCCEAIVYSISADNVCFSSKVWAIARFFNLLSSYYFDSRSYLWKLVFFAVNDLERSCGCFSLLAISGSYLFEFASLLLSLYACIYPCFRCFFFQCCGFYWAWFYFKRVWAISSCFSLHYSSFPSPE